MEAALNKHLERVAAAYQPRDSTTVARGDDDLLLQPDAANPNGPLIVEVEMRINGGEAYLLPALLRRVVAQRSAVLGPNHKETLFAANTLGTMLLHLGALHTGEEPREVVRLYRWVEEGRTVTLGPRHEDTLSSVCNLALLLGHPSVGQHHEAARLFERAIAGQEEVYGARHPNTRASVRNLKDLLEEMNHK